LLAGSLAAGSPISSRHIDNNDPNTYPSGSACEPCEGEDGPCTVVMTVELFASETGYFKFEGCSGINPTLHLRLGKTYIFDQSAAENWYHLVGFAYEADGAHVPVDELEPGVLPPGSADDCLETLSCPAPMYFMNGTYQGVYSNNAIAAPIPSEPSDDFGLDAVEPLFFLPVGDWEGYGKFITYLMFDTEDFAQDFFYFCHIHAGMSGRIKLLDADGNFLSAEDNPALPYTYPKIDYYDKGCGTYNLTDYRLPMEVDQCPDAFLCGGSLSSFAKCVNSMNCHMMSSMTTYYDGDEQLFSHQMIPHHQNAVNMAKSLLLHVNMECDTSGPIEEGAVVPWQCELKPILLDIINTQNSQIIDMRDALEGLGSEEFANCEMDFDLGGLAEVGRERKRRKMDEEIPQRKLQEQACEPCAGTSIDEPCTLNVKVDIYSGELGYYEFEECEGINPVLHLTVGKLYYFDQTDKSNWYHLIGFAYEADGAHVPVDELEPGITPPGSTSPCAESLTCPAPMYWMDGVYQGSYSNIPDIVAAPEGGSDDFGLDAVEPLFFHPIGDWEGYGSMVTSLMFNTTDFAQDFFYFCHVHSGMSGRVKLKDADGNLVSTADTPALPYEYDMISDYDSACGTFGLDSYQVADNEGQCPSSFVCDTESSFADCVDSMNCAMLDGMTSAFTAGPDPETNDVVLFLRQMIPHHQNAVNMAKALLKTGLACDSAPAEEGDAVSPQCLLEPIAWSIINVQNKQIQVMQGILETLQAEEIDDCDFTTASEYADEQTSGNGGTTENGGTTTVGGTTSEGGTTGGTDETTSGEEFSTSSSMMGDLIAMAGGVAALMI